VRSPERVRWQGSYFDFAYFSFTKSKTKIDQTPTVNGKSASCSSRIGPPRGIANVSANIARAVSTPRINLVLKFMVSSLALKLLDTVRQTNSCRIEETSSSQKRRSARYSSSRARFTGVLRQG
jgi:hypothetical protein